MINLVGWKTIFHSYKRCEDTFPRSLLIMAPAKQQLDRPKCGNVIFVKKRQRPIRFEDSRISYIGVEPLKTNLWILSGGQLEWRASKPPDEQNGFLVMTWLPEKLTRLEGTPPRACVAEVSVTKMSSPVEPLSSRSPPICETPRRYSRAAFSFRRQMEELVEKLRRRRIREFNKRR